MNRKHMLRRCAALTACAGASAIAALGGATAAVAQEKKACATPGFASGSSLQNSAMTEVWLTATGWGGAAFAGKGETACTVAPFSVGGPTIKYTKTASGNGLEEFGNNDGKLHPEEDPGAVAAEGKGEGVKDAGGKVLDFFVGTDDPPTAGQNGEAKAASGAKNNLAEITIPVAQAPVAVMLSLPAGCKIKEGSKLDLENKTIGQLWEGLNKPNAPDPGGIQEQGGYKANTWGAFLTQAGYKEVAKESELAEGKFFNGGEQEESLLREVEYEAGKFDSKTVKVKGGGCGQEIKPQARFTESGTSFAFKSYLAQINHKTWGPFADDFTNWPSSAVLLEDPKTSGNGKNLSSGGGNLAENTAANPGSVGYANSADAAKNGPFTEAAAENQFGTGKVKEYECKKEAAEGAGEEFFETQAECEAGLPNATKKGFWKRVLLGEKAAKSLKHQILWAQIQNDGTAAEPEASGYADPLLPGETHAANCETTSLVPSDQGFPTSYNDSWAGILATDPNIKGDTGIADYPICALTYDLAWHHYQVGNLYGKTVPGEEVAWVTHNLMEYITTQGETDIAGKYYQRTPIAMGAHIAIAVHEVKF
jgi:hypothetical protein